MPKYMFEASYTVKGVNGLLEVGGSQRRAAIGDVIESVGGTMESFYYAFGDSDLYVIADLPDDEAATALSLRVSAAGAIGVKTTVLITPESIDEAAKRSVNYQPPGA